MQNRVSDWVWVMRNSADLAKGSVKEWRLGRIHWVQGEKYIAKGRTER